MKIRKRFLFWRLPEAVNSSRFSHICPKESHLASYQEICKKIFFSEIQINRMQLKKISSLPWDYVCYSIYARPIDSGMIMNFSKICFIFRQGYWVKSSTQGQITASSKNYVTQKSKFLIPFIMEFVKFSYVKSFVVAKSWSPT